MSVQTPDGILVEVETVVPAVYVEVDDLTSVRSGTTSPITRTRTFGTTYRTRSTKEYALSLSGLLNASDPGQIILLAAAATGATIKLRVTQDAPGSQLSYIYTGQVSANTHEASAEDGTLQTVTFEFSIDSKTDVSLTPITRYFSEEALPGGAVFSRTSIASKIDASGNYVSAASGERRNGHYVSGQPTTLAEEQRTNVCLQSASFNTAPWNSLNASLTGGFASPDGGTNAMRITGNTGIAMNGVEQNCGTITAGQKVSISISVKQGTSARIALLCFDAGGTFGVIINPADGTLTNYTAGGGTVSTKRSFAQSNGFYRAQVTGTVGGGSNAVFRLLVADASGAFVISSNENFFAYGAQLEKNTQVSSSYIATVASSITRSADILTLPLPYTPRPMTIYAKGYDIGTGRIQDARLVALGDSMQFVINSNSGGQYSSQRNFGSWLGVGPATTSSPGDLLEFRAVLLDTGGLRAGISLNGGAESTAQDLTAIAIPSSWGASPHIAIGYDGGGVFAFQKVLVLNGEHSMAELRSIL